MCGRFSISVTKENLKMHIEETYGIFALPDTIAVPRYNVAPSQPVIAIIHDGDKHRIGLISWGFVPSFAKAGKNAYTMINARSETLFSKKIFATSAVSKRCIILADGFYEWKTNGAKKQPMRIMRQDKRLFAMAGIYTAATNEDGSKHYTCAIVTTEANTLISPIHERMPVILTKKTQNIWLDSHVRDPQLLQAILSPYDSNEMIAYPVSHSVNNVRLDSPECILPFSS